MIPVVWARRREVSAFVIVTTAVSLVLSLIQSNVYTAETSLLPDPEKSKLLSLGGLSEIASAAGLSAGEAPLTRLYPMIIRSDRILSGVIHSKYSVLSRPDSVDLIQCWHLDDRPKDEANDLALNTLRSRMDLTFDSRLLTLILRVNMEEARLAADVANQITAQLDMYTRTKRRTSATAQREFIEQRVVETQSSLSTAEDRLRTFREKNRRIADSPWLLLEQARLEREVQVNSTVFIELKKQFEIAKIEEIKNIPVANILDSAKVPISRSSPRRTATVLWTFSLSLVIGILSVVGLAHPATAGWIADLRSTVGEMWKRTS